MANLQLGPIVGGLSDTTANLWARAEREGLLHAWLGRTPSLADAQPAGQSWPLAEADGFAGVVPLQGLEPNTHYHYTLTLDDTPPDPEKGPYPEFRTFPPAGQKVSFTFALGSCFRPKDKKEGRIFETMAARRKSDDLRFMLLIGDQIYADAYEHNGLEKIAVTLDDYRDLYHYAWKRPALQHLLANLPAFMTLDDHEVDDDWYWQDDQRQQPTIPWWNRIKRKLQGLSPATLSRERVQAALKAYWEHQAMHAPSMDRSPHFNEAGFYTLAQDDPGSLAYSFTYGAAAFFVMDTRTRRVWRRDQKTVLGDHQWETLQDWLLQVKDTYPVKFLVTSSALLMRLWVDLIYDRWGAFPAERAKLLDFLADNGIEGVYILSGDLHSTHTVSATLHGPGERPIPIWEFCATPFEQSPNWLANYTFNPFSFGKVTDLKRHFSVAKPNFGLVAVNFSDTGQAQVSFTVYGKQGALLNSIDTGER